MAEVFYRIYSARGSAIGGPLTDLHEAERLAAELSRDRPEETISLGSSFSEHPTQGELIGTLARFRAGQKIPPPKTEAECINELRLAGGKASELLLRSAVGDARDCGMTVEQIAAELGKTPAEVADLASGTPGVA